MTRYGNVPDEVKDRRSDDATIDREEFVVAGLRDPPSK
jgi:hypothetical protein